MMRSSVCSTISSTSKKGSRWGMAAWIRSRDIRVRALQDRQRVPPRFERASRDAHAVAGAEALPDFVASQPAGQQVAVQLDGLRDYLENLIVQQLDAEMPDAGAHKRRH